MTPDRLTPSTMYKIMSNGVAKFETKEGVGETFDIYWVVKDVRGRSYVHRQTTLKFLSRTSQPLQEMLRKLNESSYGVGTYGV